MLNIGWSHKDVSTEKPVLINGQAFGRISKGILDPITITCLVMEDGEDCVIFLSGDFVSGAYVIDELRAKISTKRNDIPTEKILFNVTHTHTSPQLSLKNSNYLEVPHDMLDITPPDEYRSFFLDKAVEAITEAWDGRKEGSFSYGYGYAVVGHSRRVTYLDDLALRPSTNGSMFRRVHVDGHAKMYGNTNDDMFAGFEGGADHFVNLLYTFDADENLTGALINVPCPSQNSEIECYLSASYWNEVRILLRKKYGDIYILPQCASAGDTCPNLQHYLPAQKRRFDLKFEDYKPGERLLSPSQMLTRMDIALRICDAFDEVLSWCAKEKFTDVPIKHTVKTIYLDEFLISDEQYEFCCNEFADKKKNVNYVDTGDALADFRKNTMLSYGPRSFEEIMKRYEEQKISTKAPMELHVIRIGDIAFASNAFELFQDFHHSIQARSPFTQTFIVQLCAQPDGYRGGYLATQRALDNKGYSANMFSCRISPEGGWTLVNETVAKLKELYS